MDKSRNVPAVSATETGQHLAGSGGRSAGGGGAGQQAADAAADSAAVRRSAPGKGVEGYLGASTAADPLNRLRGSSSTAANLQVGLAMLSLK